MNSSNACGIPGAIFKLPRMIQIYSSSSQLYVCGPTSGCSACYLDSHSNILPMMTCYNTHRRALLLHLQLRVASQQEAGVQITAAAAATAAVLCDTVPAPNSAQRLRLALVSILTAMAPLL